MLYSPSSYFNFCGSLSMLYAPSSYFNFCGSLGLLYAPSFYVNFCGSLGLLYAPSSYFNFCGSLGLLYAPSSYFNFCGSLGLLYAPSFSTSLATYPLWWWSKRGAGPITDETRRVHYRMYPVTRTESLQQEIGQLKYISWCVSINIYHTPKQSTVAISGESLSRREKKRAEAPRHEQLADKRAKRKAKQLRSQCQPFTFAQTAPEIAILELDSTAIPEDATPRSATSLSLEENGCLCNACNEYSKSICVEFFVLFFVTLLYRKRHHLVEGMQFHIFYK